MRRTKRLATWRSAGGTQLACWLCALGIIAAITTDDIRRADGASRDPSDDVMDQTTRFVFDLPGQPLASALNAVGAKTGLELFYDTNLVANYSTRALRGSLTASEALSALLAGSDLTARSVAAGAVTIAPLRTLPSVPERQTWPDRSRHAAYFAMIQNSVARAFCQQGGRAALQRSVLRFTITGSGAIEGLQMLVPAGRPEPNPSMVHALRRVTLDEAPPPDLPQPLMMLIGAQSIGETLTCAKQIEPPSATARAHAGAP